MIAHLNKTMVVEVIMKNVMLTKNTRQVNAWIAKMKKIGPKKNVITVWNIPSLLHIMVRIFASFLAKIFRMINVEET